MKEYNKRIYEQAEQFGIENRMLQCSEEAGELIQALCKYQRILNADKTCNTDMVHAEYMIAEEIHGTADKPYYVIKYYDIADKEWHIGYGSYYLHYVFQWLEECFEIVEQTEQTEQTEQ